MFVALHDLAEGYALVVEFEMVCSWVVCCGGTSAFNDRSSAIVELLCDGCMYFEFVTVCV